MLNKRILGIFLAVLLCLPMSLAWAKSNAFDIACPCGASHAPRLIATGADQPPRAECPQASSDVKPAEKQAEVKDLTKAYEVWKKKGIKFVVRDENGHFKSWGIGRLESWGAKSKWVVRDPKGHFLAHATGQVEKWKNGQTRLVLRTPKGQIMTHISINLTDKASFAQNVIGLRRLEADNKFIDFVQETLSELLIKELKDGDTLRTKVLLDYIRLNKTKPGMKNFVPVLRATLQQLNFMAGQNNDPVLKSLAEAAKTMLNELK